MLRYSAKCKQKYILDQQSNLVQKKNNFKVHVYYAMRMTVNKFGMRITYSLLHIYIGSVYMFILKTYNVET